MAQLQREKRLEQAARNNLQLQTDIRSAQKAQKKEEKVIGNLSIIVGPNRRGDIVVRVGDDLNTLVRTFIAAYGLKKDVAPTILGSLQQLVRNHALKEQQAESQRAGSQLT